MKKSNLYHDASMWKGASVAIFMKAQHLRKNMTEPEKVLWERLSKKLDGYKFRRQHPILYYIADFYCHALLLVIEIDGEYHGTKKQIMADTQRTADLQANGITIIRFTNEEVMNSLDSVILRISETIDVLKKK